MIDEVYFINQHFKQVIRFVSAIFSLAFFRLVCQLILFSFASLQITSHQLFVGHSSFSFNIQ